MCINNCKLCDKFILSQSIVYNVTVNQLIVDLPSGVYTNCGEYCIVLAQTIPAEATINAQVVFTIGGDQTIAYPFLNNNCTPILASQVRNRRIYKSKVNTAINSGVFKYIGNCKLPCKTGTVATGLPITNL